MSSTRVPEFTVDYNEDTVGALYMYDFEGEQETAAALHSIKQRLAWPDKLWEAIQTLYWPLGLTVKELQAMLARNRSKLEQHAKLVEKQNKKKQAQQIKWGKVFGPFFQKYDVLRSTWGYMDEYTAFEIRSAKVRAVQYVTDILMRFLRDGTKVHTAGTETWGSSPLRCLSGYDLTMKRVFENATSQQLIQEYLATPCGNDGGTVEGLLRQFVHECDTHQPTWPDVFQAASLSAKIILDRLRVSEDNLQTVKTMATDEVAYPFETVYFIVASPRPQSGGRSKKRGAAGAGGRTTSGGSGNLEGGGKHCKQSACLKRSTRRKQSMRLTRRKRTMRRKRTTGRKQSTRR